MATPQWLLACDGQFRMALRDMRFQVQKYPYFGNITMTKSESFADRTVFPPERLQWCHGQFLALTPF